MISYTFVLDEGIFAGSMYASIGVEDDELTWGQRPGVWTEVTDSIKVLKKQAVITGNTGDVNPTSTYHTEV